VALGLAAAAAAVLDMLAAAALAFLVKGLTGVAAQDMFAAGYLVALEVMGGLAVVVAATVKMVRSMVAAALAMAG
jgi:hypothetical protein